MTFFKAIAKFIRILFMLIGLFTFAGVTFMLLTESGRLVIESYPIGPNKSYLLMAGILAIALFLFVYNIISLSKGIDVFFWLIFKHKAYREKYLKNSKRRPEVVDNTQSVKQSIKHEEPKENINTFGSNDIIMLIQTVDNIQIGYSDNKLYISDVQVSLQDINKYLVNIDTIIKLIDPPKDQEQLQDFKKETNVAVNKMADACNKKLSSFAKEYSFYYEIKVNTRIER